jgi:tetratricopeptide (TPR) repeat protein
MRLRGALVLLGGLLLAPTARAQHEGHSHSGGEGELGVVHFPVSCNEAARKQFRRAVAMLHSFWYEESEKAFREVAAADPRCGMAWWGVAMTQYHPIWYPPTPAELAAGRDAVAKARAIGAPTGREKAYIEAIGVFYDGSEGTPHKTRAAAYEKAMGQVAAGNPDDLEAAAFHAVALLWTLSVSPNDETNPRQAAAILDRIAGKMPSHPGVLHYYIHAYDTPKLAPMALDAARAYAKVAPAVPHALHMPSHIFTRLGLWPDAIESNRASARTARDYETQAGMAGAWDQELHALDYLEYAYLQRGDDESARAVLDRTREVQSVEPVGLSAAYALSAVPVRWCVEGRRWTEAATLKPSPADFPWEKFPIAEAMTAWARARGSIHTGERAAAAAEIARLQAIRDRLAGAAQAYDWSVPVEILRLEASGWLALSDGKKEEAISRLREAASREDATDKHAVSPGWIVPAREQLAEALLEIGRPGDALKEYETAIAVAPNRFNALAGAAVAAKAAGNTAAATKYSARLIEIASPSSKRPELVAARAFMTERTAAGKAAPGR